MTTATEFLQTRDVAARLAITPTRVGQLVKAGAIPVATRLGDGTPLFAEAAVERVRQARVRRLQAQLRALQRWD